MNGHIVVAGSINMDFVIRTPHHPQLGETVIGGSFQTFPGGKGANQSVAASRAGANVKLIGRVGNDSFGESLMQTLIKDKIDTSFIQIDDSTATGVAFIIVDYNTGENNIVLAEGANGKVTPQQILAAQEIFNGASVFTFNLECPLPALAQAVKFAKKYGAKVVMNPAPYQPLPADMLAEVDYLIPNQIEISSLLNSPSLVGSLHAIEEAVGKMQREGGLHNVIVTLGEKGALVIENGRATHIPSYPVKPVDTVAAGDAFVGSFSVAISEGRSLLDAARFGNATGAIAVTRPGAQPSMPTRTEIEQFMRDRN